MVVKQAQEKIRSLLTEAITVLCKNGLSYRAEFCIEGLLGITLDSDEVFLVNIKETVKNENAITEKDTAEEDCEQYEDYSSPLPYTRPVPMQAFSTHSVPSPPKRHRKSGPRRRRSGSLEHVESEDHSKQTDITGSRFTSPSAKRNRTDQYDEDSPAKRLPTSTETNADSHLSDEIIVIKEEQFSDDEKDPNLIADNQQSNANSMSMPEAITFHTETLPGCSTWDVPPVAGYGTSDTDGSIPGWQQGSGQSGIAGSMASPTASQMEGPARMTRPNTRGQRNHPLEFKMMVVNYAKMRGKRPAGRFYGVSEAAVRDWCKRYATATTGQELPETPVVSAGRQIGTMVPVKPANDSLVPARQQIKTGESNLDQQQQKVKQEDAVLEGQAQLRPSIQTEGR